MYATRKTRPIPSGIDWAVMAQPVRLATSAADPTTISSAAATRPPVLRSSLGIETIRITSACIVLRRARDAQGLPTPESIDHTSRQPGRDGPFASAGAGAEGRRSIHQEVKP